MHANVGKSPDAGTVDGRPFGSTQGVEGSQRGASRGRRGGRKEQTRQLLFVDLEILSCCEHIAYCILWIPWDWRRVGQCGSSEREPRTL